jgi:hypothetical protein
MDSFDQAMDMRQEQKEGKTRHLQKEAWSHY